MALQLDRLWLQYWVNKHAEMAQLVQNVKPIIKKLGTKMQRGVFFQVLALLSLRLEPYVIREEAVRYARIPGSHPGIR